MFKTILKCLFLIAASTALSGCLTTMYVMKKMNEVEYSQTQISSMSNYGLVTCKHRANVKENSRNLCSDEIQSRIADHRMTSDEYSKYEMNIESYRQVDINASKEQMHEQLMQNQVLSAQETQQANEALKAQDPLNVNVHHSF